MATASERLRKQAKKVAKGLGEVRGTANDAAQDTLRHVRENGAEHCAQGRAKVHQAESALEHFIQKRPLKSVLIAAGVGALFGSFWLRRLTTTRAGTKSAA
jgi:ElaB/YqjD/DUF883 family membrane-anchored ribosome-binding protein